MSRTFQNTAFEVGPSPAQWHQKRPRTCVYDVAPGRFVFIESHFRTLNAVIGWGLHTHCPKVNSQKRPEHSRIRKEMRRAGSLQSHTLPHTSSGSEMMIERVCFCMSLHDMSLFKKLLLTLPLIQQHKHNIPMKKGHFWGLKREKKEQPSLDYR